MYPYEPIKNQQGQLLHTLYTIDSCFLRLNLVQPTKREKPYDA